MSDQEKGKIIGEIIVSMQARAGILGKSFDSASMFFDLAFASEENLKAVAKASGVSV